MSTAQRIAVKEAKTSIAKHYRVAAVIHSGKRIIAKACNIPLKTHTNGSGIYSTCHAEVRVIARAKSILGSLEGYSIFVARLSNQNELKPSQPCPDCWKLIESEGLIPDWT